MRVSPRAWIVYQRNSVREETGFGKGVGSSVLKVAGGKDSRTVKKCQLVFRIESNLGCAGRGIDPLPFPMVFQLWQRGQ